MYVKTRLNKEYVRDELVWELKTNLHQLNQRLAEQGRLAQNYLYELLSEDRPDVDVQMSTVDALHNVIMERYVELGIAPPDDLWDRLIVHEVQ